MQSQRFGDQYVLKLAPGEEVVETLRRFINQERIGAGYFMAFGAFRRAKLCYFDPDQRRYLENEVDRQVEVVSLMGNIAHADGEVKLHIHGAVGDREARTYSGHLAEGVVEPTLEVFLTRLSGELRRAKDAATGLDLLDLDEEEEDPSEIPAEAIRTGATQFPYSP